MVKRALFEEAAAEQTLNELRQPSVQGNERKYSRWKNENKVNEEDNAWCLWEKLQGQCKLEKSIVGMSEAEGVA